MKNQLLFILFSFSGSVLNVGRASFTSASQMG